MKKLLCLGLLLGSMIGLTGCTTGPREGVFDYNTMEISSELVGSIEVPKELLVKEGTLTVGTSPDYAPYSFLDLELEAKHQLQGAEIALAYYVSQVLGLELEFKQVSFSLLAAELNKGTIDVAFAGYTFSEDRAENYSFTDTYHKEGDGGQVLLVLSENLNKYLSVDDINKSGVKVGAQNASIQSDLVSSQLPYATKTPFGDIAEGVLFLNNKSIDLMASSSTSAESIAATNANIVILESYEFEVSDDGTMGLMKKDSSLLEYINKAIDTLEEGSYGVWLDLYAEYAEEISFVNE